MNTAAIVPSPQRLIVETETLCDWLLSHPAICGGKADDRRTAVGVLARMQFPADFNQAEVEHVPLFLAWSVDENAAALSAEIKSLWTEIKTIDSPEAFAFSVSTESIQLVASGAAGLFYGLQTITQLSERGMLFVMKLVDWPDLPIRGFHLELRIGRPTWDRLLKIVDECGRLRINTILLEYEDRFPFEFDPRIPANDALSREQIRALVDFAEARHITVIPLQQSLGHLEYVLKHERYRHLRELQRPEETSESQQFSLSPNGSRLWNDFEEIHPCSEEAVDLVKHMITEVCDAHAGSTFFHVGADEAWNFLKSGRCGSKPLAEAPGDVFARHIATLWQLCTKNGKRLMLWDDMLREFTDEQLAALPSDVIVMCWIYFQRDFEAIAPLVARYRSHGLTVIGASSVKCNERGGIVYQEVPNYLERLENIRQWVQVSQDTSLAGLLHTAWSGAAGTVAPPHPLFDTVWLPLVFGADASWNRTVAELTDVDVQRRVAEWFFGVRDWSGLNQFSRIEERLQAVTCLANSAKRHKYEATALKVGELLSLYRQKHAAVQRHLYKLHRPVSAAEKRYLHRRIDDLRVTHDVAKSEVVDLLSGSYSKELVDEFVASRFSFDSYLLEHVVEAGHVH